LLTAVATALANTGPVHAGLAHLVQTSTAGQQPALPGFLNSLSGPLTHYGLWAIALLVLVEDFGIPVPGETVLIAGAVYAGSGRLNVVAVGVVGFIAAVLGDNIGYLIGRFGGRALVLRWGRYVFITPERLEHAESFFERHGGKIITIARFIEGLRQANGLIAGITHMHWLKFAAFNALGAALWVGTWVSVGYFAGQHITTIYNDITSYSLYAAIAAVVLIAALVLLRLRRRRKKSAAALLALPAEDKQATPAEDEHPVRAEDEQAGPVGPGSAGPAGPGSAGPGSAGPEPAGPGSVPAGQQAAASGRQEDGSQADDQATPVRTGQAGPAANGRAGLRAQDSDRS
jgi:membrane protein DedA with SNARE-associated domain